MSGRLQTSLYLSCFEGGTSLNQKVKKDKKQKITRNSQDKKFQDRWYSIVWKLNEQRLCQKKQSKLSYAIRKYYAGSNHIDFTKLTQATSHHLWLEGFNQPIWSFFLSWWMSPGHSGDAKSYCFITMQEWRNRTLNATNFSFAGFLIFNSSSCSTKNSANETLLTSLV